MSCLRVTPRKQYCNTYPYTKTWRNKQKVLEQVCQNSRKQSSFTTCKQMLNREKNTWKLLFLLSPVQQMARWFSLPLTHLLSSLTAILKRPVHLPSGILFFASGRSREAFIHRLLCLFKNIWRLPKGLTQSIHLCFA